MDPIPKLICNRGHPSALITSVRGRSADETTHPRYDTPSMYEINTEDKPNLLKYPPTMPVTEVATLPLVAGSDVLERGSQAARIWQDMIATISAQEGFQYIYSGLQHESPNTAQMFIGKSNVVNMIGIRERVLG
jgi:hypothetical protein